MNGTIRASQLADAVGDGYRQIAPQPTQDLPLLGGRFSLACLRPGLDLHCTDIEHLRDMHTRFTMRECGIKVMLKLEGDAEVSVGHRPILLDAGHGRRVKPCGAVLALAEAEEFVRRARAGTREKMVVLTLSPEWLEACGLGRMVQRQHLEIAYWRPSPRAIAIAEQLIRPEVFSIDLLQLHQESRALDLVCEALGQTDARLSARPSQLRPADFARTVRLRKHLENGEFDGLTMSDIARRLASNPSTLQQHFRLAFGKSIIEFQRECRLLRAAEALRDRGVSVTQAADIAGYASQANFSTAFRRRFGLTPKQIR